MAIRDEVGNGRATRYRAAYSIISRAAHFESHSIASSYLATT